MGNIRIFFTVMLGLFCSCSGDDSSKNKLDLVGKKIRDDSYNNEHAKKTGASQNVLRNVFTIDLLQDLVFRKRKNGWLLTSSEAHVNLDKLRKGGVDLAFSAIQLEPQFASEVALERAFDEMKTLIKQTGGSAMTVSNLAEAKAARAKGKMPFMILLEGADSLEGAAPERLFALKKQGLAAIGLVGNRSNAFGGMAALQETQGLTQEGARFVNACRDEGIAIDLTHASQETFWDVIVGQGIAAMVSHTAVRSIREHPRNLNDIQIIALQRYGGIMGVVFNSDFLKYGQNVKATVDDLVAHYRKIKALGALSAAALGTDFGGVKPMTGLEDVSKLPDLAGALERAGFSSAEISGIFGKNAARFLGAVESKHGAAEIGAGELLRPIKAECDVVIGESSGGALAACDGYIDDGPLLQAATRQKLRIRQMGRTPVKLEIFGEPGTPWQVETQNLSGKVLMRRGLALDSNGQGTISIPGNRNPARIFLSPTRASTLREAIIWGI